jgi:hypothetical protein
MQIAYEITRQNTITVRHLVPERDNLLIPAWQIAPVFCAQQQLIGPPMHLAYFFEILPPFSELQSPEGITKRRKVN